MGGDGSENPKPDLNQKRRVSVWLMFIVINNNIHRSVELFDTASIARFFRPRIEKRRGLMEDRTKIMETWFQRVWAEEDESAIEEMFIDEGAARGLGTYVSGGQGSFADHERIGPAGFKEFHKALLSLVSDVRIEITKSMEQGDWLAVLCVLKAKKRGTEDKVQTTGTVFIKIADGKLLEAYNHFDFMSLFGQLGQMPANAFGDCLCGKTMG
jgi:predicted ester cyclase